MQDFFRTTLYLIKRARVVFKLEALLAAFTYRNFPPNNGLLDRFLGVIINSRTLKHISIIYVSCTRILTSMGQPKTLISSHLENTDRD